MKYSTDDGQTWNDYYISALDSMPLGSIILYAGDSTNVPAGWMLCDGTSLSEEEYPALYDILGYKYGGSGTSFNLPNFKGRVGVGLDSTQTEFDNLGETGGEKTHTLTTNEMPTHNHAPSISIDGNDVYWGGSGNKMNLQSTGIQWTSGTNGSTIATSSTGGGQPHNNLQPYLVVNYIIKVEQLPPVLGDVLNSHSDSTIDTYSCDYSNEHYGGVVLYNNDSGSTGDFSISDDRANYKIIEIQYGNDNYFRTITRYNSQEVYVPLMCFYNASWGMQIQTCQFIIRGTSAQKSSDKFINCSTNDGNVSCGNATSPSIKIYKVVGYK